MNRYKPTIINIITALCVVLLGSCYHVPMASSQPAQTTVVDDSAINILTARQYTAFINSTPLIQHTVAADMINRVGGRMSLAVLEYFASVGRPELARSYQWQFLLADDPTATAWALPDGTVVISNGILPFTVTDGGLAAIMGHTMAHVIARHGYQRLGQALQRHYGPTSLTAAWRFRPLDVQTMYAQSFDLGTTGAVAYNRTQEYEADDLAIYLMRIAGYSQGDMLNFWQGVIAQARIRPLEYIATHPGDQDRLARMGGTCPGVCSIYGNVPIYQEFGNSFRRER
jgi:predicted Zn-dependent protease